MSTTISFNNTSKFDAYTVAADQLLGSGTQKSIDQLSSLASTVSSIAESVPGGSHVNGSLYFTIGESSLSGSISLTAHTPEPQPAAGSGS